MRTVPRSVEVAAHYQHTISTRGRTHPPPPRGMRAGAGDGAADGRARGWGFGVGCVGLSVGSNGVCRKWLAIALVVVLGGVGTEAGGFSGFSPESPPPRAATPPKPPPESYGKP